MFGTKDRTINNLRVVCIALLSLSLSACIATDFGKKKSSDQEDTDSVSAVQAPAPAPSSPTIPTPPSTPVPPTPPPVAGIGSQAAFEATLYPLMRGAVDAAITCATCHTNPAIPALMPAVTADNAVAAHDTHFTPVWNKDLVNLANPAASEIVTKVAGGHYCWSADCAADANMLRDAIQSWNDQM